MTESKRCTIFNAQQQQQQSTALIQTDSVHGKHREILKRNKREKSERMNITSKYNEDQVRLKMARQYTQRPRRRQEDNKNHQRTTVFRQFLAIS